MKSATVIVVATIVMNTGNNSKNSTGYDKPSSNGTMSVVQCRLPGFQIFVSTAGIEQHDGFRRFDFFPSDELADCRKACAAFGRSKNAFEPRHLHACRHQIAIAHGYGFPVTRIDV